MDDDLPPYDPFLDRPVWGAKNIADVINRSVKQTYHLLEQGHLDAEKCGGIWRSTTRRLLFPSGQRRCG
jgi:hypothetical protein